MSVDPKISDAVLGAERRLAEAVLGRDRAAAEAVLDEAFLATGHSGNVVDRPEYLGIHFAPERRFTRFDPEGQELFAAGDAVVVTGQVTMFSANLAQNPPPARYAAFYLLAPDGTWRLRYWQETPIDASASF